jgi:hypothetical protein
MSQDRMASIMTPGEMAELLATLLEGAAGGSHDHWLNALGPVEQLPTHLNLHCNWRVQPKAGKRDLAAIKRAIEIVRAEHPYVVA